MESATLGPSSLVPWYAQGAAIPTTSPAVYLTGMAALNIPAPEGTGGDWHRTSIFGNPKLRLPVAGDVPNALVDTNPILGSYGIHECSDELRAMGVPIPSGQKVYCANHIRAILDLVIHASDGQRPLNFLQAGDFLDNEEQMHLLKEGVRLAQGRLDGLRAEFLARWFSQQA
jgi:hypothetical protein